MSSNISDFFTMCNMKRYCEVKIGERETEIVLPFCFDISKINMTGNEVENYLDEYRSEFKLKKIRSNLTDFLSDVDYELFEFDGNDTETLEYLKQNHINMVKYENSYRFEHSNDLYKFLNLLSYSETDFAMINDIVVRNRSELFSKFINMVSDELKIGDKKGKVTEAYMVMRGAMEHSSSCIFPENIGKAVSQYSWREGMVKRLYLARKVEVEEYYMEKAKRESKQKNKR